MDSNSFPLYKASLDAYSVLLYLVVYDVLCTTCMVLFDDGEMLHGSTISYIIFDVVVLLFMTRCVMRS
jgi:hypothetical protein